MEKEDEKKVKETEADTKIRRKNRYIVLGGVMLLFIIAFAIDSCSSPTTNKNEITQPATPTTIPTPTETKAEEPKKEEAKPAPTQVEQTDNQNSSPVSSETIAQKNAVKKAISYLDYSAFSHDGLVAQLEYEQFSHDDALYGADNSGANWNEQAAKKAKQYMDYSAFSRGSLIEQLKYDKFTQEQAEYGADAVGL